MYMSDHLMAQVDGAMAQVPKKGGDLRHCRNPNT